MEAMRTPQIHSLKFRKHCLWKLIWANFMGTLLTSPIQMSSSCVVKSRFLVTNSFCQQGNHLIFYIKINLKLPSSLSISAKSVARPMPFIQELP